MAQREANPRVYPDTSTFGGTEDAEFMVPSRAFFEEVRQGRFVPVVSGVVAAEIQEAPAPVRGLFHEISRQAEWADVSEPALALRDAYLAAQVVTERWSVDALHVALATVFQCDMIVSWNFHHIVHFQKIPRYNAVNRLHGYRDIGIYTPQEVLSYGQDL